MGPEPRNGERYEPATLRAAWEAIVKLGLLNSRMKDFYDIWLLSRQFNFDGPTLATAVSRTFVNRKTPVRRA